MVLHKFVLESSYMSQSNSVSETYLPNDGRAREIPTPFSKGSRIPRVFSSDNSSLVNMNWKPVISGSFDSNSSNINNKEIPLNIRDEFEDTYIYFLKYFINKRKFYIQLAILID
jgi:hypothetical protein